MPSVGKFTNYGSVFDVCRIYSKYLLIAVETVKSTMYGMRTKILWSRRLIRILLMANYSVSRETAESKPRNLSLDYPRQIIET